MRSTVLLLIALAAGAAGSAQADDAKQPPAAKDAPNNASRVSVEVKAGTGVEKRGIVGEAERFPAGTTVWVWSRITGGEGNIKHVWKRGGKEMWTATLQVGSKDWTTSSRHMIDEPGSWQVDVQDEAGVQLATVSFTIQ